MCNYNVIIKRREEMDYIVIAIIVIIVLSAIQIYVMRDSYREFMKMNEWIEKNNELIKREINRRK